jgi:hypothetical protein
MPDPVNDCKIRAEYPIEEFQYTIGPALRKYAYILHSEYALQRQGNIGDSGA